MRIAHAAIRLKDGTVLKGKSHGDIVSGVQCCLCEIETNGFVTDTNEFVDRKAAAKIAYDAKQVGKLHKILISEDLWQMNHFSYNSIKGYWKDGK